MPDIPVFPIRALLGASKNRTYREGIFARAIALFTFLESHGLLRHSMLNPDGRPDAARNLYQSDLTQEGAALIDRCLFKWLGYTDRGGDPANVKILIRELEKMRGEKKH